MYEGTAVITLKRPWPTAIAEWGKDIENRTWKPRLAEGSDLLIHAGKGWDQSGANWLVSRDCPVCEEDFYPAGVIVAIATYEGWTTSSQSEWFVGPIGWKLSNVRKLKEQIPAKGKLGIWYL